MALRTSASFRSSHRRKRVENPEQQHLGGRGTWVRPATFVTISFVCSAGSGVFQGFDDLRMGFRQVLSTYVRDENSGDSSEIGPAALALRRMFILYRSSIKGIPKTRKASIPNRNQAVIA